MNQVPMDEELNRPWPWPVAYNSGMYPQVVVEVMPVGRTSWMAEVSVRTGGESETWLCWELTFTRRTFHRAISDGAYLGDGYFFYLWDAWRDADDIGEFMTRFHEHEDFVQSRWAPEWHVKDWTRRRDRKRRKDRFTNLFDRLRSSE